MGLTSPFQDGNGKNQINCFPAMQDRNENYQKAFHCSETRIQGVPIGKYTGAGNPAHDWRGLAHTSLLYLLMLLLVLNFLPQPL